MRIHLATTYKDISQEVINQVTDFLTRNKERLNAKSLLFILEKINSQKIIESLLNKIESFSIKEEELYNPEENIESFQLLDGIQKGGLLEKLQFEDLNKTKYLMNAIKIKDKILSQIKKGEVNYNSLIKIWLPKNRAIFKEKLRILFFNNANDVEESMKIINEKKANVFKELQYINKVFQILKEFFENQHKNNILKIEQVVKAIKTGMLNEIEKPEIKKIVEEIHNIFEPQEIEYKGLLKDSMFFLQLYRAKKVSNIYVNRESEIFEQTESDFNKLKKLFETDNWNKDIPESIIKECFKALKHEKRNRLNAELKILIKIFYNRKDFDELKIEKLEKDILTYNQKEEIFLTANSCMHLIDELEAIKTGFYKELDEIRNGLLTNIDLNKIENYG